MYKLNVQLILNIDELTVDDMSLNEFKYFVAQVDGHVSSLVEVERVEQRHNIVLRVIPFDDRGNHRCAARNGEGDGGVKVLDVNIDSVFEES